MLTIKTIALVLGTALATTAATLPFTGSYLYSSEFQCSYPLYGAFNMVPSAQNVWHAHLDDIAAAASEPVLVDIDGNGQQDALNPLLRVVVTDVQYVEGIGDLFLEADGDLLWVLRRPSDAAPSSYHFQTPLVVPQGAALTVRNASASPGEALLHGRVLNL